MSILESSHPSGMSGVQMAAHHLEQVASKTATEREERLEIKHSFMDGTRSFMDRTRTRRSHLHTYSSGWNSATCFCLAARRLGNVVFLCDQIDKIDL